jgi:hypothetical protein
MTRSWAAMATIPEVDGKIKAMTDGLPYCPHAVATWAALAAIRRARYTMFMSFGRALFVAWCVWIGTLVAGSVAILLLDRPEWRVAVGTLSLLIGLLAFIFSRRI